MRRLVSLVFVVLALAAPSAAVADSVTVPPEAGLPWTDPAHRGPLEVLASQIASRIVGRPVSVRCEGENDWNMLARTFGFDPAYELGYVRFRYYLYSRLFAEDSSFAELSPKVCWYLQEFAKAAVKPTKCRPLQTVTETVYRTRWRWVTEKVWVLRRGRWVIVTKRVRKRVLVPVTITRQVQGDPTACYLGNGQKAEDMPTSYWQEYRDYSLAILVLAHEAIHLAQFRAGVPVDSVLPSSETKANCYGLQWMPWVAVQLGATLDDARAIARYAYEEIYPSYQGVFHNGSPYWSPDCRQDGPLDLTPGDGAWP